MAKHMRPAAWEIVRWVTVLLYVSLLLTGAALAVAGVGPELLGIALGATVLYLIVFAPYAYPGVLAVRALRGPGAVTFVSMADGLVGARDPVLAQLPLHSRRVAVRADAAGIHFATVRAPVMTASLSWDAVERLDLEVEVVWAGMFGERVGVSSAESHVVLQPWAIGGIWLYGRRRVLQLIDRLQALRAGGGT